MDCSKFEELIEQYLDNSLDNELKIEFENHMSECNSCKDSFNFSKEIRSTLHNFPLISVPEDFSANLNKRLDEELAKEQRTRRLLRIPVKYYGVAACALLAVALNISGTELFVKAPEIEQNVVVNPDLSKEETVSEVPVSTSVSETEVISDDIPEANEPEKTAEAVPSPKPSAKTKNEKNTKTKVKKPVTTNKAVVNEPVSTPEPAVDREKVEKAKEQIDNQVYKGRVVIASAVEQAVVIDEESVTKMADDIDYIKSYSLLKEAAENKSIASVSTLEQLKNVEVVNNDIIYDLNHDGTSNVGAIGNSIIVYKRDAEKINNILHKYYTRECGEFYVISDTEYEQFLSELEENGINYTKSGADKSSANDIMFKLVIA